MKKILIILKKAALISATPIIATASTMPVLVSSVKNEDNSRRIVPPNYLKLSSDKATLLGFESFVTPNLLRKGKYNTIVIPTSVTKIAPYAFAYMFDGKANNIETIDLNTQLQEIGQGAFIRCYGIKELNNLDNCVDLTTIDQDAFLHCRQLSTELVFPRNLKTIGNSAFRHCESLPQITLSYSLTKVGDYAFNNCFALSFIMITDMLDDNNFLNEQIPVWATDRSFAFLGAGTQADMPFVMVSNFMTPKETWEEVFDQNLELKNFEFMALYDETSEDFFTFEDDMQTLTGFADLTGKVTPSIIKIPDSVKRIKASAFANKITSDKFRCRLVLNDGLEEIGENAFSGCSGISGQLNIPNSVKSIGQSAFKNTHISGTLSLPNNDNFIQVSNSAFEGTRINKLVLPSKFENVEYPFGESAFKNCYFLNTIDTTSFSGDKYPDWKDFTAANIPFENVGNKGLIIYPYKALLSQTINYINARFLYVKLCPDPVSSYWTPFEPSNPKPEPFPYDVKGDKAFYVNENSIFGLRDEYKSIKTDYNLLNIPYGIKSIEDSAFENEFHDETITSASTKPDTRWQLSFDLGVEKIGASAFAGSELLVGNVEFPSTLKEIGANAFNAANGIGSYKIPTSVTTIKDYAFQQTNTWTEGPRLKYIDLTAFNDVPEGWTINSLFVNSTSGGTYYVKDQTALSKWTSRGFNIGNWTFAVKGGE